MKFTTPLSELKRSDLAVAGGKGANLGALIAAGLPVPDGFCVTTDAYRAFVDANGLQAQIESVLDATCMDDPAALESAAQSIRARFAAGSISPELAAAIRAGYLAMGGSVPVAVRSSATAEDLPDLSFAGQQDTYLNIVGEDAVLAAVRDCWASLWTARAIGYRARNDVAQDAVALAVVVQRMVESEVSGVLFTANPLTGKRDETVIDATFGLGEALVSGQVEPDHYVVDAAGKVMLKTLGAKALAIRGKAGGGTQKTGEDAAARQALPDDQIVALARLGQQAAQAFGGSQDMEWTFAGGKLSVVQSRPITSLYPLPESCTPERFEVLFSFAAWQGMLDPYTPLGQDVFSLLVAGVGRMFGANVCPEEQRVFLAAGERLYVNITVPLSLPVGRIIAGIFVESIDPAAAEAIKVVLDDPRLPKSKVSPGDLPSLACGLLPVAGNAVFNLLVPRRGRQRLELRIERALQNVRAICASAQSPAELAQAFADVTLTLPKILLPILLPAVIAGQIPLQGLIRRSTDIPGGPELALELTRGLPHNVTTEMDLSLWRASRAILADPASAARFSAGEVSELVDAYRAGQLPAAAQTAVGEFLAIYGLRGVGEIDLGRVRWVEDPLHILQVLQSYIRITDESRSPEAVFARGAEAAAQAQEQLVAAHRRTKGGAIKACIVRAAARRVRELTGLRESPKFAIVRLLGTLRLRLLEFGRELADKGVIARADDLFFLHARELAELDHRVPAIWQDLIAARRGVYDRELRRRRLPHLILSDGTTFYESAGPIDASADTLTGTPVSAGVVEGVVHVVRDPHGEQLAPGEILVCPATDPAWTPLFLAAGGLVMEVGGMITHGSVVAREYGLPAVVGVDGATERLKTGQRVRVDGTKGTVVVLE
jgi:pyruvate,water dikinase